MTARTRTLIMVIHMRNVRRVVVANRRIPTDRQDPQRGRSQNNRWFGEGPDCPALTGECMLCQMNDLKLL